MKTLTELKFDGEHYKVIFDSETQMLSIIRLRDM